jgi:hypothetical protein
LDDRSILAVLVSAIKQVWVKVLALVQSDEAQNARIEQLEAEVAALISTRRRSISRAERSAGGLVRGRGGCCGRNGHYHVCI